MLEGRLARRTVHSYRRGLLILWRFAVEDGLVEMPPRRIRRIKIPKLIPKAWKLPEAVTILPQASRLKGHYRSGVSKARFWIALILAIWDSGLRLGDALRIRWTDFDSSGAGCIEQKKTGWPKPFQLSAAAMVAIETIRDPVRPLVFGGIISRKTVFKTMRKLTAAVGLTGGTKKLRKSGATAVESKTPGAAKAYLGHKTPDLAYQFYVDPQLLQSTNASPPPLIG